MLRLGAQESVASPHLRGRGRAKGGGVGGLRPCQQHASNGEYGEWDKGWTHEEFSGWRRPGAAVPCLHEREAGDLTALATETAHE